jgi:hypothetical protein
MPRSSRWTQQCPCGGDRRAVISVTLAASTLGILPRRKSTARTLYLCADCLRDPKLKARRRMLELMLSAAIEAQEQKNGN